MLWMTCVDLLCLRPYDQALAAVATNEVYFLSVLRWKALMLYRIWAACN
jgi:hypothetical protein